MVKSVWWKFIGGFVQMEILCQSWTLSLVLNQLRPLSKVSRLKSYRPDRQPELEFVNVQGAQESIPPG
jgi:hypothetical protein